MAVTQFKFPPLFRKHKNVEIPKRLGVRTVVVASSNNFLLTLQDILNPDLSFIFWKMQVIKQYSRFSRFLLLRQDYRPCGFREVFFLFSLCKLVFSMLTCVWHVSHKSRVTLGKNTRCCIPKIKVLIQTKHNENVFVWSKLHFSGLRFSSKCLDETEKNVPKHQTK